MAGLQGGGIAFPQVTVGYENFQTMTIPLDPSDMGAAHTGMVWDQTTHRIRIPPIHLKRLPEYSAEPHAKKEPIATKGTQP